MNTWVWGFPTCQHVVSKPLMVHWIHRGLLHDFCLLKKCPLCDPYLRRAAEVVRESQKVTAIMNSAVRFQGNGFLGTPKRLVADACAAGRPSCI